MKMPTDNDKRMSSFRLSPKTQADLDRLAKHWRTDKTQIVQYAVGLVADREIGAMLGEGFQAVEQSLRAWGELLSQASKDNAKVFSRDEWNYLADANNGISPLTFMTIHGMSSPATMVCANANRLDSAGEKWFGKDAGKRVAKLVQKVRDLDYAHGWALVVSLQWFWVHLPLPPWFWDHCQAIDHQEDDWWTVEFRRAAINTQEG